MGIFDIIGPVMVGPSSSHTAGAARIGFVARNLLGEDVKEARILLYGSFLATGKGHGTDKALVAGLLGMSPDDGRIADSLRIAEEKKVGIEFGEARFWMDLFSFSSCLRRKETGRVFPVEKKVRCLSSSFLISDSVIIVPPLSVIKIRIIIFVHQKICRNQSSAFRNRDGFILQKKGTGFNALKNRFRQFRIR